jgi:hypothetical protein
MIEQFRPEIGDNSSPNKERQVEKPESKSYESKLRKNLGPAHATAWKESTVTPESPREQLKNSLPDASIIERIKSFLPNGLTAEQTKGFLLLAMAASAQRIGAVEVPRPTSTALDLWNNNPVHYGNASLPVYPVDSKQRENLQNAPLPVCPTGSEHLREAPPFYNPKHVQELSDKLNNPSFYYGPKDAQGTSDEEIPQSAEDLSNLQKAQDRRLKRSGEISQSATDAPSHQLVQSEKLALKGSQDVPSYKETEDITKLVEKYQYYCQKPGFRKVFLDAVKAQTDIEYPFSAWYDQHLRRMKYSQALSCSNPKSELLRRLLDDKTYKDIVAFALQNFEDREYVLNHQYDPLHRKVYDHGYYAGNRDGEEEGYDRGFYHHGLFYGEGYEEGKRVGHEKGYEEGKRVGHKRGYEESKHYERPKKRRRIRLHTWKDVKERVRSIIVMSLIMRTILRMGDRLLAIGRREEDDNDALAIGRREEDDNDALAIGRREENDNDALAIGRREEFERIVRDIAREKEYQQQVDEQLNGEREIQQASRVREQQVRDNIRKPLKERGEDLPTIIRLNLLLRDKIQRAIEGRILEEELFPDQQADQQRGIPLSKTLGRIFAETAKNLPSPEVQDRITEAFVEQFEEQMRIYKRPEWEIVKAFAEIKRVWDYIQTNRGSGA